MKKTLFTILSLSLTLVLASCGTTEVQGSGLIKGTAPLEAINQVQITDYLGASLGTDIPQWVVEISKGNYSTQVFKDLMPDLDKKKIYVESKRGQNLDALKVETQLEVETKAAQILGKVIGEASSAIKDNDPSIQDAVKKIQTSVMNVSLIGLEKQASYWVCFQEISPEGFKVGSPYYEYYTVYAIDKKLLEKQIERAMNGESDILSENEKLKNIVGKALENNMNKKEVEFLDKME